MRDGPYKLVVDRSQNQRASIYLFDLRKDLAEQHDIARQNPEQLKKMLGDLTTWHRDVKRKH